ncbi:MAG TPA: glycosyltransferase [Anaerolineae bacterium]|nr:glycosyltransferase [Anaerolineae bacterium]
MKRLGRNSQQAESGRKTTIFQFVTAVSYGDAITNHCLAIRDALQSWGYCSEIYAQHVDPRLAREARSLHEWTLPRGAPVRAIFHYSIGSQVTVFVRGLVDVRLILIYHNITPARYFVGVNPPLVELLKKGRADLSSFAPRTILALGASEYNRLELAEAGFSNTGVLPIMIDFDQYDRVSSSRRLARFRQDGWTNLLSVGRIAPNKRQEDVIKTFYYYKRINPRSRLFLVGSFEGTERYYTWLRRLVDELELSDVYFTGLVDFDTLVNYYRLAHVYVSMSEHEGFGVPLVESMHFDVPVLAYAATAVPYTLADSGVLVREKSFPVVAEAVHLLASNGAFREQVVRRQRQRLADFSIERTTSLLKGYVESAFGLGIA